MSTNIAKDSHTGVVIRESTHADAEHLRRLAQLDSAHVQKGPMVVAEVDGELRAAVAIEHGSVIADPFHRTADVVALAEMRATQLRAARSRPVRGVAQTPSTPAVPPRALRGAA
ncbi:MAG TPA: hypothetical protein VHJ54_09180 [Solirubrobacterales bacterium]|jgi:hypothetical protein|nr:hypothetical protein [Solirubrobacterales bacterium]